VPEQPPLELQPLVATLGQLDEQLLVGVAVVLRQARQQRLALELLRAAVEELGGCRVDGGDGAVGRDERLGDTGLKEELVEAVGLG
jgi:hypothetical protein